MSRSIPGQITLAIHPRTSNRAEKNMSFQLGPVYTMHLTTFDMVSTVVFAVVMVVKTLQNKIRKRGLQEKGLKVKEEIYFFLSQMVLTHFRYKK